MACAFLLVGLFFAVMLARPSAAEEIKVGILKVASSGPVFIAQDKGYFAASGLTAKLVYFGAGQAVAVAVVSGDVDIGVTGLTGGLYNLAANGEMRVLAGLHREEPTFRMVGYVASTHAWDGGLRSFKDFPGHSVAVTTVGSTNHYSVALLAEKYGWGMTSIRLLALQTIPNIVSAVAGGQADVGLVPGTLTGSLIDNGKGKLLGWIGDETPWQIGSVFVTTKTANERHDMLERFLTAMRKASRYYHDAFTGPGERRKDGPNAPEATAIIAKYLDVTPAEVSGVLPYVDPEMRIDEKDVAHQIAWYRAQGMLKGNLSADMLIDRRYAVSQP
ncbi:MAG TPA: ABC transporter substrate-binding protein [Stellaceae bacterium]|nr:ABC transporter substrate-binding protein [Stellaceae bacterium]